MAVSIEKIPEIVEIPEYNGRYLISENGIVYSTNHRRTGKLKRLYGSPNNNGYMKVGLYKDGERKYHYIHRLVMESFVGIDDQKIEVNHKNSDRTDNRLVNLEWCNRSENQTHAIYNGNHNCTKPVIQIKNGKIINVYESISLASRDNNICVSNIIMCCQGKYNKAGGFDWDYAQLY